MSSLLNDDEKPSASKDRLNLVKAFKKRFAQRSRVDKQGRLVIPADIRQELGLTPGEPISLWVEDGELRVISVDHALDRIQEHARELTGGRTGLVDEFIAERRREAERE